MSSLRQPVDYNDPRSVLEEFEADEERSSDVLLTVELGAVVGRMLAWILAAPTHQKAGFRAYIVAHKLRPDLIGGMSFEKMARQLGQGRSSAHKLSKEFGQIFGIRGPHDKSDESKRKYRAAWLRANAVFLDRHSSPPCQRSRPTSPVNGPSRLSLLQKRL